MFYQTKITTWVYFKHLSVPSFTIFSFDYLIIVALCLVRQCYEANFLILLYSVTYPLYFALPCKCENKFVEIHKITY